VLYVIGLSGALLHVATVEHHNHLPGQDHPDCSTEAPATHGQASALSIAAAAACTSCCLTHHDALPNQFHPTSTESLKSNSWSRTAVTTVATTSSPAPRPGRRPDRALPPPVRTGATTVAAGRAPPASLPV